MGNTRHFSAMASLRGFFVLISLLVGLLHPHSLEAGHLYGGAITWDCLGSGDYVFSLTLYRDCDAGAAPGSAQLDVKGHPSWSAISLVQDTAYDISPDCKTVGGGPAPIQCSSGGDGAIQLVVLSSSPVTLGGTPPPSGWTFSFSGSSRSPGPTNLVSPGGKGMSLRSTMYPMPGGTSPCSDHSPVFEEPPLTIRCADNLVHWSAGAVDPDSDSLSYEWAKPLGGMTGPTFDPPNDPVPMTFDGSYSYDTPFPGIQAGAGSGADRLDPRTGDLTLMNPSQGEFAHVVKVTAWRDGQRIAEVYREMGLVLTSCPGGTTTPKILPPFGGSFKDTFKTGQTLSFPIKAADNGQLQDGSDQSISLSVTGEAFGKNYSNAGTGCPNPPCATLSPVPPAASNDTAESTFEWDLVCDHLSSVGSGGAGRYKRYEFLVTASDDRCSVPGQTQRTVTVVVENEDPVPAPELNCVDIQGGDVHLSWTPPSGSHPTFDSYMIYRASAPDGPYSKLDSVFSKGTNDYIDAGAASGSDRYYFIRTRSGCLGKLMSAPSDTLQRLDLTVSDPNNGKAILSWNELSTSAQPPHASTGYYRIFKEHPIGTWTLIDSVPYGTTEYADTIMVCNDSLSYQIAIADHKRNCVSRSNVDGGTFSDVLAPSVPAIKKVSVDTNIGKATIDWGAVPESDAQGYLILQVIGGNEYVIDTVWGRKNTFYSYSGSNAPINSEHFAVASFDSCYSGTPPRPNTSTRGDVHNTMNLKGTKRPCDKTIELSWNNYQNWESGVDEYRVYYIGPGSSPVYVGRTEEGDTTMTHRNVPLNERVCYVIQAVSGNGRTSLSDKECFRIDFPERPDHHYLSSASVLPGNSGVEVRSQVDPAAEDLFFRLERLKGDTAFKEVKTVPWNGSASVTMQDLDVKPAEQSYSYRIVTLDSCRNEVLVSNTGHTVHLRAKATREPPVNVLQWTPYGEWDGQVAAYEIHRIDRKKGIDRMLEVVSPRRRSFEHKVDERVQEENGRYCYYVVAKESGNSFGGNDHARSNEACAFQEPYIHIPNAYIVGGTSESFKPVSGHVRKEGYRMRIYDRWGHKLFESRAPEEGWKGRGRDGDIVPEGAYVYHIEFLTSYGRRIERKGGVTLLHR